MPRWCEDPHAHAHRRLPRGPATWPTCDPVSEGIQSDRDRIRYRGPRRCAAEASARPCPAPAPHRAVLAVPADPGREHARLDGGEDLGGQAVEPDVRRAVAGRPVAVELGLLGLGEHVKAEAEVGLVGEAVHGGRVAVDRELERRLDLEVGVLARRGLEVNHDQAPVGIALDEVEGADQVPVEDGAGRLVDERHGERRLDGDDLGRVGHLGAEDREHPGPEVVSPASAVVRLGRSSADGRHQGWLARRSRMATGVAVSSPRGGSCPARASCARRARRTRASPSRSCSLSLSLLSLPGGEPRDSSRLLSSSSVAIGARAAGRGPSSVGHSGVRCAKAREPVARSVRRSEGWAAILDAGAAPVKRAVRSVYPPSMVGNLSIASSISRPRLPRCEGYQT